MNIQITRLKNVLQLLLNHIEIILNYMIGLDLPNTSHDIENQIYLQIILVILNIKVSQTMALVLIDPPIKCKIIILRIIPVLNNNERILTRIRSLNQNHLLRLIVHLMIELLYLLINFLTNLSPLHLPLILTNHLQEGLYKVVLFINLLMKNSTVLFTIWKK